MRYEQKPFDNLPSAIQQFDEIKNALKSLKPVVFLDYDGTLTPIVSQPEDAVLSDEMRSVLKRLASKTNVIIVSGRDRQDVQNLVSLDFIYAGSHGFDITGPDGLDMQHSKGQESLKDLGNAQTMIEQAVSGIAGARVERKKYAVAVHFRNVKAPHEAEIEQIVDRVAGIFPTLKKTGGKKIFELRPNIDWDKGKAVLWLLSNLNLDTPNTIPIYIGDDLTDEDAFYALIGKGISILVGAHEELSYATYSLADVAETQVFLSKLASIS